MRRVEWLPRGCGDSRIVLHDDTQPYAVTSTVTNAVKGIEAPDWTVVTRRTPGVNGVTVDSVRADRNIEIPVFLWASSRDHLRRLKSELVSSLVPADGSGRLMVSEAVGTASGSSRYLTAIYMGGMEGNAEATRDNWWRFTIQFQALDPFWYSTDPLRAVWSGRPATPLLPFRIPFRLSDGGVVESEVLDVRGDGESWPSFDLRGPFSRVRVTNPRSERLRRVDSDAAWEITRQTGEWEMLRLSTKPGEESLRLFATADGGLTWADQGSVWSSLSSRVRQLEPLLAGDALTVEWDGSSSLTQVELTAPEAWLTAP